jgi:dTDP-4-amino-4,6-dideoxygalactose transaminase
LFGRYRGGALGGLGAMSALSFHETKNISCGEGGALLLNDPGLMARAEILREKGTNRSAFFRGQVDKYSWVDVGSSFLPSDILAAFLWAQLESAEMIQRRRHVIWQRYADALQVWARDSGVGLLQAPAHCEHPAHLFYLLMPSGRDRDGLIEHLRQRDVNAVFHYLPLHASPMAARWPLRAPCPQTERVSAALLRLPLYAGLTAADQDRIIDGVISYELPA